MLFPGPLDAVQVMGSRMANQHCTRSPISDACLKSRTFVGRASKAWHCQIGASTTDFKSLRFGGLKKFSFNFSANLHQMPGTMIEFFGGQRNFLTITFLTKDKLTEISTGQTVLGSQLRGKYTLNPHAHNLSHVMVLFRLGMDRNETKVCAKTIGAKIVFCRWYEQIAPHEDDCDCRHWTVLMDFEILQIPKHLLQKGAISIEPYILHSCFMSSHKREFHMHFCLLCLNCLSFLHSGMCCVGSRT